jgi:hypothetical protein
MRAWQFETATGLLDEATVVLEQREAIDAAAARAGLTPPDSLRTAFEGDDGFADATIEIEAQLQTIDVYADAVASEPADPDLITQLGLWDTTPRVDLAAAAKAYAAGDLEASVSASESARLTWLQAPEVGRTRALIIGSVATLVVLLLMLGVVALVRLARGRNQTAAASDATRIV